MPILNIKQNEFHFTDRTPELFVGITRRTTN